MYETGPPVVSISLIETLAEALCIWFTEDKLVGRRNAVKRHLDVVQ